MNSTLVSRGIGGLLTTVWLPAVVVAAIWVLTTPRRSPFFPPLGEVFTRFGQVWLGHGFTQHIIPSLVNSAAGFVIALVLGAALGVAIGRFRALEILIDPLLQFLRGVPGVALLPLMILLLGTSDMSKIALIAFGAIWPILLNTIDGVKAIPPEALQSARSYRISGANVLLRVILPGAFPQMSIGIRLSLSIALVLMVASEYYGSARGVGFFILQAKQQFDLAGMWAGVLLLGIIGYLISTAYSAVERRMLRWRGASSI